MLFSIIIPTCARNDTLAKCLDRIAVAAQSAGNVRCEILVSDDDPSGSAQALILKRFPVVKWIHGPCKGPAANRNCGARQAVGDWLVFTDDDCLPEAGWLAALGREAGRLDVDVLEGMTLPAGDKTHPLDEAPINDHGGMLWSCNLAVRRDLFVKLGGFDERFPYAAMEDVDFREKMLKAGARCLFLTDAVVSHPWRRPDVLESTRKHSISMLVFVRLHPERSDFIKIRNVVGIELRIAVRNLVREFGRWPLKSIHALVMRLLCMFYRLFIYGKARV